MTWHKEHYGFADDFHRTFNGVEFEGVLQEEIEYIESIKIVKKLLKEKFGKVRQIKQKIGYLGINNIILMIEIQNEYTDEQNEFLDNIKHRPFLQSLLLLPQEKASMNPKSNGMIIRYGKQIIAVDQSYEIACKFVDMINKQKINLDETIKTLNIGIENGEAVLR